MAAENRMDFDVIYANFFQASSEGARACTALSANRRGIADGLDALPETLMM